MRKLQRQTEKTGLNHPHQLCFSHNSPKALRVCWFNVFTACFQDSGASFLFHSSINTRLHHTTEDPEKRKQPHGGVYRARSDQGAEFLFFFTTSVLIVPFSSEVVKLLLGFGVCFRGDGTQMQLFGKFHVFRNSEVIWWRAGGPAAPPCPPSPSNPFFAVRSNLGLRASDSSRSG